MQGHFPLTRVSSRRLAKSYSTLNAQTPDLVPPPLCLDLITPRSCVSCSEAMGALPTLGRMIDSLGAERNDRSKEERSKQRELCVCDAGGDPARVALSRTPPPPRASNVLPPFPFFFSLPTAPFSRRYHENTDIFKPRWSNQHGHREVVLDQLVGPTRPRSWPNTRISLLSA